MSAKRHTLAGLALFLCLGACADNSAPPEATCTADIAGLSGHRVERVVDGDTLHLSGGGKLRMIGINTPEMGRRGGSPEPLAEAATRALRELVGDDGRVWLQPGRERTDRHGRQLAHVFGADGHSLEAELLRRGLGFHVAVAPNFNWLDCLHSAEQAARRAGRGVWAQPYYRPRAVADLDAGSGGFTLVRDRVTRVSFKDNGWWVQLGGKLGLRIDPQGDFQRSGLSALQGQVVQARGWLVAMDGWWMMRVDHPSMLHADP